MADKTWPLAKLGRRAFVACFGGWLAPVALAAAPLDEPQSSIRLSPAPVPAAPVTGTALLTLSSTEAAFVAAAVDAFIPADELSPSGSECGVVDFIDRQLAGAWGAGSGSYRSGPYLLGAPELGEQLPLAPREFFRESIRLINEWTRAKYGADFDQLSESEREDVLHALEHGQLISTGFDSNTFFTHLLQLTYEGFFADPIYGGNRDKIAWRMIGYPGLPSLYAKFVKSQAAAPLRLDPRSISDFS